MRRWLLVLLFAACAKQGHGSASRDDVIAAWQKAGLQTSSFTAVTVELAKDCASGTVNNLDVLICVYASEAEAKAAQDRALKWVGDYTGASKAQGPVLIAVADRRKADPSGRTIHQVLTLPAK
jgi:hypothetical protein